MAFVKAMGTLTGKMMAAGAASVGAVGALSASLGAIPQTTLLPDENLRCGIGAGAYANQWAGSFGCAVKITPD